MEMDLEELAAVGRSAVSVAVVGVVLPMAAGFAVMLALGESSNTALFLSEFGQQLAVCQRQPTLDPDILPDLCPPDRWTAINGELSVLFPTAPPA